MNLSTDLIKRYTTERLSAREAQRLAEFIAWGPVVFQVSRLMLKFGILDLIRDSDDGLTREEIVAQTGLSDYAVKCLLEASLSIGLVLVDVANDKFTISKTKPEGLKHFGDWPTVYEGLSSLPPQVQKSWFGFDHFYSDSSFPEALKIIFDEHHVKSLYDVGGNTGKWALQCVSYQKDAEVTILDLPQQIAMMQDNIQGKDGADRISGYGINLLDERVAFPHRKGGLDAIWMSQFLDCFSMEQITSILRRAKQVMTAQTRIYIMETLWDRQRFEPAAFCLTMTSLYFTAIANGNSKMYNTEDMEQCINNAGLEIEQIHDHLGQGHSILVCKL